MVLKYHFPGKETRFPREVADSRSGVGSAQDEAGTSCQTENQEAVKHYLTCFKRSKRPT